jgi:hypothetical protein
MSLLGSALGSDQDKVIPTHNRYKLFKGPPDAKSKRKPERLIMSRLSVMQGFGGLAF